MGRSKSNADLFQAIADPTRRQILEALRLKRVEQTMSEIAAPFDVTLSSISQHLRILRDAKVVTVRQVGRERRYRLSAQPLKEVSSWVQGYKEFWDERLGKLGAFLDADEE